MDCDFPSIYRSAYEDAERRDELKEYAKSFRLNVGCACAIEHDIRACAIGNGLQAGCVDMTLERYGFQRVSFVLANSLCKMEHPESIREDVLAWGEQIYVPPDGDNNRYYAVDAATPLLEAFIGQVRETYQTLGLFGPEHCVNSEKGLDYTGKVLVLSPNTLKESCWSPLNQLWLGETGFGCSPTASGRAVYATCLGDGEQTRWNRADFIGVLDEQYLPDWAREKLEELTQGQRPQGPEQTGPTMNKRPNLIVYKHDADTGEPIPNTVFTVRAADGHSVDEIKTDSNGRAELKNLLPGVYEVSEKSVPAPWLQDAPAQMVTLYPNRDHTLYFKNHKKPTLTVNKVDSVTGSPIKGAKFEVWYGSNNTTTGELNSLGTYFSDVNGQFILDLLRDGWYKVTELEPAAGFTIKEPATQEIYIKGGENKVLTFENVPLNAIAVEKYDSVTGEALPGCTFQLRYLAGASGTGGNVIGTKVTGKNGTALWTGLKPGTYILEEVDPADGYSIIQSSETILLADNGEQSVVTVRFTNAPDGMLLIRKVCSVNPSEKWKPSAEDPGRQEYAGQRTAQEVFEELKHRLESQGYLPNEYFLLDSHWENGREIPKDASIFCTADYGGSEGVYLDAYLQWPEHNQLITRKFLTGKTLGENGNDLDRMFLISSAITKAFHGDHADHARYMKTGGVEDDTGGAVVHLSQQEQRTIINALVEQRERQEEAMSQTEQLLRRMTGSITAYINETGMRPLRMSDYDKAVLAVRDGEMAAFTEHSAKVPGQAEVYYADRRELETAILKKHPRSGVEIIPQATAATASQSRSRQTFHKTDKDESSLRT